MLKMPRAHTRARFLSEKLVIIEAMTYLYNVYTLALGLEISHLFHLLLGYRTPFELEVNKLYFEPLETCPAILEMLKNRFTAN